MIKALFRQRNVAHSDTEDIAYEAVLTKCREHLKVTLKEQIGLTGREYNEFIRKSINNFIEDAKPIIDDMLNADGSMNYKMLNLRLYEDINEFGPITEALSGKWTDIVCSGIGPGNLLVMKGMQSEILCDSNGKPLFFKTVEEIQTVVNRLAYFDGAKRLTTQQPNLRCTTSYGRLTATDKSICAPVVQPDGKKIQVPTFDIRMPSKEPLTLDDMVHKCKTMHPMIAKVLQLIMGLEGIKMVFSGVPGSGKTTVLYEVVKTLHSKSVVCIAETPEGDLWEYNEDGISTRMVKSWCPTHKDDGSNDMSRGTLENLFYTILSTKTDIIVLSEVRSIEEINMMLKTGISGKAMVTTMHGEDAISTFERCIKDIMSAKRCSRNEAIMEAVLSINIIVGMYHEHTDHTIRVGYISELEAYESPVGMSIREHRLYDFRRQAGVINPNTGFIKSNYCKVGVPTQRLQAYMNNTAMTPEDRALLLEEASAERPVVFEEVWW